MKTSLLKKHIMILILRTNSYLENIFQRWDIKSETVIKTIKTALTQYKNKYDFQSMLNLCNKYIIRIIKIYGAAGNGKGLIDAMSSFGVKSVL